jgi:hypothetical protein
MWTEMAPGPVGGHQVNAPRMQLVPDDELSLILRVFFSQEARLRLPVP